MRAPALHRSLLPRDPEIFRFQINSTHSALINRLPLRQPDFSPINSATTHMIKTPSGVLIVERITLVDQHHVILIAPSNIVMNPRSSLPSARRPHSLVVSAAFQPYAACGPRFTGSASCSRSLIPRIFPAGRSTLLSSKAGANEAANRTRVSYGGPLRFTTRGIQRVTCVNAVEIVRRQCLARTPLADFFNGLLDLKLGLIEPGVYPTPLHECRVIPFLDDRPALHHDDAVHVMERG